MIHLPQPAQKIIDTLKKAGFVAYAVGGSVRDLIMGKSTKGWDFTTNAQPEELLKVFPDSFYDNKFGTVGIKMKNPDDIYEITPFRKEGSYSDHRHPDKIIWGKTIEEDLSRRDFTINAIALEGKTIIDPYGGQKDIEAKLIRSVGNPSDRFAEDALRIMRAVRIGAELGFMIEPATADAIKTNVASLTTISAERIHDELMKLMSSPYPADGVILMRNSGILKIILPELENSFDTQQKSPQRHHIYDVGTHSIMALKFCPSSDPVVRFATLLHDIGKPKTFHQDESGLITFYNHEMVSAKLTRNILERLRFSKKDLERILALVRWHQFSVDERQTDSALRRFIRRVGKENLADILALRIGDRLGGGAQETSWRLELYKKRLEDVQKQPFTVADLAIDGHDVMKEFGIKPGPQVGNILLKIFKDVESHAMPNEREALLFHLSHKIKMGVATNGDE